MSGGRVGGPAGGRAGRRAGGRHPSYAWGAGGGLAEDPLVK